MASSIETLEKKNMNNNEPITADFILNTLKVMVESKKLVNRDEDSLKGRAHQVQKENFEVCPTLKRKM